MTEDSYSISFLACVRRFYPTSLFLENSTSCKPFDIKAFESASVTSILLSQRVIVRLNPVVRMDVKTQHKKPAQNKIAQKPYFKPFQTQTPRSKPLTSILRTPRALRR
jgi:hypothetical protein